MIDWISVEKSKPKNCTTVLVTDGVEVGALNYRNGNWFVYGQPNNRCYDKITHWMPLPKPPAE